MGDFQEASQYAAKRRQLELAWLKHVLETKQWSSARLAAAAKIHPSVLLAFTLDKNNVRLLGQTIIDRLSEAADVPWKTSATLLPEAPDNECIEVSDMDHVFLQIISSPKWKAGQFRVFKLTSEVLVGRGYRLDDYLVADTLRPRKPINGDVVIARQQRPGFQPRLIARELQMPYLCTAAGIRGDQLIIWNDSVEVLGLVVASGRETHH
jgi:hypothetical protein